MKFIVIYQDSGYNDPFCTEVDGDESDVATVIEDLINDSDLESEDFTVYELGKQFEIEQKILLKETTKVILK